jgi:ADP-ribosylglycohydrolase
MVEFQEPDQIEHDFPGGPLEIQGSKVFRTIPGQPTDDSELALLLARSIITSRGYNQEAAARAYAWWYDSHPFDIGNATRQALSAASAAVKKGAQVSAAAMEAADGATQANGALMRVSPLGIYGWSVDTAELEQLARLDARLTHPSKVCQDANAVFVLTIARAVRTGEPASALYQFAHGWVKENGISGKVAQAIRDANTAPPADFLAHAGWVLVALQNAFYQLLHSPSLAEGVIDTVRHGGDTDTNAAIAGALLGAVHGGEAVPSQWREAVANCKPEQRLLGVQRPRPRELWPADFAEIAKELLAIGGQRT